MPTYVFHFRFQKQVAGSGHVQTTNFLFLCGLATNTNSHTTHDCVICRWVLLFNYNYVHWFLCFVIVLMLNLRPACLLRLNPVKTGYHTNFFNPFRDFKLLWCNIEKKLFYFLSNWCLRCSPSNLRRQRGKLEKREECYEVQSSLVTRTRST